MKKLSVILVIVLSCFLLLGATQAQAFLYGFYKITDNSNPDVSSQLLMDVTDAGGGQVAFKFTNSAVIGSSITDIYFDDGTLLGIASITDSGAGVAFANPATPGNLPGGNLASPAFVTTADFSADSSPPDLMENGVNSASEWVTITFNLINGKTFANTLAALALGGAQGGLRVGLHVQSIDPTNGSDGYVNTVPIPAAAWLLGSGLLGLVAIRRRYGK